MTASFRQGSGEVHASANPADPGPRGRGAMIAVLVVGAALWRLWLMTRYWGWEESDYGDLAMVRGVLDQHFLHYDINHLPGYYALAAVVLAAVGDTVVASNLTSLVGGLVALGLAVVYADRLWGRRVAWVAGALLVVQPEFALYAASSLREPVYAAFVMGCLVLLLSDRMLGAGLCAGAAFLIRFEGAVALAPVLAIHALGSGGRLGRLLRALGPLLLTMVLWSLYCRWEEGSYLFWSGAVAVNLATGEGQGEEGVGGWLANGLSVAGTLGAWVMPWRIGWAVWLGGLFGLAITPWREHGGARTAAVAALCFTAVWTGMGFTAQHAPEHNLYWKWLCGVVPVVLPFGVAGAAAALSRARLPARVRAAVVALALVQAVTSFLRETERQVVRSVVLYKPQVDLARWIEATVPEGVPLVLDNIPACWIERNPTDRRLITWMDIPSTPGDPAAFSAWLRAERIGWVLWFAEEWTEAPRVAPFLADGGTWTGEGVRLVEQRREDQYGWIFYRVDGQDSAR